MINFIALSLVMASLAGAGVFSPTPQIRQNDAEQTTIVKEGHRVVVVKYDQDGHRNTKISITPEQPHREKFIINTGVGDRSSSGGVFDETKERIKEAASVLPNIGKGLSSQDFPHRHDQYGSSILHAPKELICESYGKCKHKIADAMGKAKDIAKESIDTKKEEAKEIRETFTDAAGKAKDTVSNTVYEAKAKAKDTFKGAIEVGENVADKLGKAKDTVSHRTHHIQEQAKESGNTLRRDVSSNVSETIKNIGSYIGSKETIDKVMSVANLMGFATSYGLCIWVTFVSSYVISRAMPRQQFGVVQSRIYPVYFKTMAYCVGLALLGHVLRHRKAVFFSKAEMLQVYNLLASLFTLFANSMYLEPRATKVMFERMKIEKEEGRGMGDLTSELGKGNPNQHATETAAATPTKEGEEHDVVRSRIIRLNDKLKRLNSYSSLLNILNLMSLTWHLVYLAQCLHQNC